MDCHSRPKGPLQPQPHTTNRRRLSHGQPESTARPFHGPAPRLSSARLHNEKQRLISKQQHYKQDISSNRTHKPVCGCMMKSSAPEPNRENWICAFAPASASVALTRRICLFMATSSDTDTEYTACRHKHTHYRAQISFRLQIQVGLCCKESRALLCSCFQCQKWRAKLKCFLNAGVCRTNYQLTNCFWPLKAYLNTWFEHFWPS